MAKESTAGKEPADNQPQALTPETLQAQVQAILDQARQEAAKIVAAATAAGKGELSEEEKVRRQEREAYLNELVEVKLFKDNNKYKDDVFVSVNGDNCYIKRGERVRIKRKFAEVLEQSDRQDFQTAQRIEKAMEMKKLADL